MEDILNPTTFIGNFEWREPVTTLTDFMVAIVALIGFIKFLKYKGKKSKGFNYFKYYFLFFAIGMTSAAWFGHGLQAYVGPEYKRIGWIMAASGLLMFGLGSLEELKENINFKIFLTIKTLYFTQYLFFVTVMIYPQTSDFIFAQLSSTISLIAFILPIQIMNFVKSKSKGNLIIIATIGYSIIPGLVYNNQLSFNKWFNYHDISHVLMAIFMSLMILGTSKLTQLDTHKAD